MRIADLIRKVFGEPSIWKETERHSLHRTYKSDGRTYDIGFVIVLKNQYGDVKIKKIDAND